MWASALMGPTGLRLSTGAPIVFLQAFFIHLKKEMMVRKRKPFHECVVVCVLLHMIHPPIYTLFSSSFSLQINKVVGDMGPETYTVEGKSLSTLPRGLVPPPPPGRLGGRKVARGPWVSRLTPQGL